MELLGSSSNAITVLSNGISNKKILIVIALTAYSMVFLIAGFTWAVLDYRLLKAVVDYNILFIRR